MDWWRGRGREGGKGRITHVPVSLSKPIVEPSQREASAAEKKGNKINTWSEINTPQSPNAKKKRLIALLET